MYNWYTVNTGKLAPVGWHVPSDSEWATLATFLGGESMAGGKLKESGTSHWTSPNTGGTNETGFTAVPGGYRLDYNGTFSFIKQWSFWWSNGVKLGNRASYSAISTDNSIIYGIGDTNNGNPIKYGFSVRCLMGDATAGIVVPTVTTNPITSITQTTATSGGNIISNGDSPDTASGVCWSTSQDPTTATNFTTDGNTSSYTSNLTGLIANTTYYVWAYATNSVGTAYGNEVSFKTNADEGGTVTDIDGNVYHTVTIGTQVWMVENLKTTKYNDGTSIPNVTDNTAWSALTTGAYCWYNNDASYKNPYGALFNLYSVNTGKLAPSGWHVPSDAEWTILTNFLGVESVAGGKLKETGTTHWYSPNTGATNESGFTALPGGYRLYLGAFYDIGSFGLWWSSTESSSNLAWRRYLYYLDYYIYRNDYYKSCGFSVRCVRD